jgi:hypothetical protein
VEQISREKLLRPRSARGFGFHLPRGRLIKQAVALRASFNQTHGLAEKADVLIVTTGHKLNFQFHLPNRF